MSITELAGRLRTGQTTARTLAESALASADELNPSLNCFVTIDHEGALRAADQADRELATGMDRGPLHGVPVGVKDMIDTAGLRTTRGSRHFEQHVPTADAAVVVSLRQAGAVIVGKTHTHEFAYGPTGDVAHTGPARNPHDPSRMTGGSSAGSGAAVAAGIVPAALGTDTGGSVRIPAALCGIVGLRPTQGALDGTGVFPLSSTLDTVGPMAASVADTALLWAALTGHPVSIPPLAGLRVGVLRPEQVVNTQEAALDQAVTALTDAGFALGDVAVPELIEFALAYPRVQSPEVYAVHADRVAHAPELFQPELLDRMSRSAEVRGWEYVAALDFRARQRAGFPERLGVDLLMLPTVPIQAPPVGARDTELGAGWTNPIAALLSLTSPWSMLGVPAISVPVGADPLPASVQLVGRPGGEDQLLAAAAVLSARV
jgi:aspartyl-tRNA(Asn)/glutamyl-tRNA(Gln) amidotransferase subunit A